MSTFRTLSLAALLLAAPAAATAQGKIDLGGKSLADLEKGVQADPNEPLNHVALSLAYFNNKDWDKFTGALNTALAIDPRNALAHLLLSTVPYAQRPRLWEESVSALGVATSVTAAVDTADWHYRMAFFIDPTTDVRYLAPVAGKIDEATDFGKGMIACHEGRYDACYASLTQYFSKIKATVSGVGLIPRASYWYNGIAAIHQKDPATAAGQFGILANRTDDDTRKLAPADLARVPLKSNDMQMMVGVVQYRLNNQPADALSIFQKVVAADPSNVMAHVYSANIYETQQNWDRAVASREAAIKADPSDALLHYELGLTLAKARKVPEALPHFQAAADKLPRHAMAWYYLGVAKETTGDQAGAKAAFAKAVANASNAQAKLPWAATAKTKAGAF